MLSEPNTPLNRSVPPFTQLQNGENNAYLSGRSTGPHRVPGEWLVVPISTGPGIFTWGGFGERSGVCKRQKEANARAHSESPSVGIIDELREKR